GTANTSNAGTAKMAARHAITSTAEAIIACALPVSWERRAHFPILASAAPVKTMPLAHPIILAIGAAANLDEVNHCDGIVCQHGGTCRNQPTGFVCHCPLKYQGTYCEIGTRKTSKTASHGESFSESPYKKYLIIAAVLGPLVESVLVAVCYVGYEEFKRRRRAQRQRPAPGPQSDTQDIPGALEESLSDVESENEDASDSD
ncbi:hypothetical protein BaRGS_00006158, partial [Batillaria attramentaria]